MVFGFISVNDKAVSTHRDSYLLSKISVVSVRRPFLAGTALLSMGAFGFTASFSDILFSHEKTVLVGGSIIAMLAGYQIGQLKLVSRELSGNPLADVIYGRYAALNATRLKIAGKMEELNAGGDA